ncbi:HNH endonuclease [Bacillus pumilus]|uniref:HNH endonuclease n=1 Tax=Bacillus pumilus TaxID=1408 RepID=UPI0022824DEE|nr:HNH endonuclease [Bacillus pumilus]MCY7572347.1 HNH endonuclease [Bacillus pumilus]MCY7578272.1 HNH endonuclease [Bacillus pumilus]MEC3761298.1 HNH endonuclease [Bacillus pumilus]
MKLRKFLCATLPLLLLVSFILPEFAKAESAQVRESNLTEDQLNDYIESSYENYDDFPYAQEYEDWDNYEEYQGLLEDDVTDEELEKDTISDDVFEKGELVEPSFSAPADAIGTNDDVDIIQAYPFWLVPLAFPVVMRIGGKLYAKQYLKNSTKKVVIRNGKLAKKKHPKTGVKFTANGFPVFNSKFNYNLPGLLIKSSNKTQFAKANASLKIGIKSPKHAKKFTKNQIIDINHNKTPRGYVWHHHENTGRLQLVNKEIHKKTGHTGGRAIWGRLK